MYNIEIADRQDFLDIDEPFLRAVALRTLAEESVASALVSVALVDNRTIHKLNRQFLKHDYETDVLSFLLEGETRGDRSRQSAPHPESSARGAGKHIEGEIVISAEKAVQTAEALCWSPRGELVFYLVHGLLHLVGYDDLAGPELDLMRKRERMILDLWDLHPPSVRCPDDSPDSEALRH